MPDKPEPKRAMKNVKRFLTDESGMGVVEILLITVAIFTQDKSVYKMCIW